jgi:hypothetical protein
MITESYEAAKNGDVNFFQQNKDEINLNWGFSNAPRSNSQIL